MENLDTQHKYEVYDKASTANQRRKKKMTIPKKKKSFLSTK